MSESVLREEPHERPELARQGQRGDRGGDRQGQEETERGERPRVL